jgi:hypothetical protein
VRSLDGLGGPERVAGDGPELGDGAVAGAGGGEAAAVVGVGEGGAVGVLRGEEAAGVVVGGSLP